MNSDQGTAYIVSGLRKCGAFVHYLDPEGGGGRAGLPDLLACLSGRTALLEVKSQRGRLNPAQEAWHARWREQSEVPVVVVRSLGEALAALGIVAA